MNFQCAMCRHYEKDMKCRAFPDGMPGELFSGETFHDKPFKGDDGIQFEPMDEIEKADNTSDNEFGRDKFDAEEGDKGKFIIHEHLRGLSEEEVDKFRDVTSFESWENTKSQIKRKASSHSDFRWKIDGRKYFIGFTLTTPSSIHDTNDLIHPKGKKILVAAFKSHGPLEWIERVGKGQCTVQEPGEPGATVNTYAAFFMYEEGQCKATYVKESGHAISLEITDTKRIPEGQWNLNFVPVSKGRRIWLFDYQGK